MTLKGAQFGQGGIVAAVTLVVFAVFAVLLDGFAALANAVVLVRSVSVLGILATGMAIVVIARGLDLSQVATMAAVSAWMLKLMGGGLPIWVALLAGLALALVIGLINGALIAYVEMPALFVTLAMGFLIFGAVRTGLLGGDMLVYLPESAQGLQVLGQGAVLGIPVPVFLFAGVALAAHFLLSATSIGRFIYAHGDNSETARLTGIPVRPLTLLEYALSAAAGYIAGLIMAASSGSVDLRIINSTLNFDAILVVVLGGISLSGGRGGIGNVLAGTALIGTLLNGMVIMNLSAEVQSIVKGLVLLGAILLDNALHPTDEEVMRQGDI